MNNNLKITTKKIVTYQYQVVDNYNHMHKFNYKADAELFLDFCKKERKIINYIKPTGVTLVVSKNPNVYVHVVAAFIGYNGVPFCEASKDKKREFFINPSNSIEDHFSHIYGNIVDVIKKSYDMLNGRETFDKHDGAYHYYWNTEVGNEFCFPIEDEHWKNGVFWYNWDGKNFITNDKTCKLTNNDFIK